MEMSLYFFVFTEYKKWFVISFKNYIILERGAWSLTH